MVITYSHAKGQGQRSVGSKDREYTNRKMYVGQREVNALPDALMQLVKKQIRHHKREHSD